MGNPSTRFFLCMFLLISAFQSILHVFFFGVGPLHSPLGPRRSGEAPPEERDQELGDAERHVEVPVQLTQQVLATLKGGLRTLGNGRL